MPSFRVEAEHPMMSENGMEFFYTQTGPLRCTAPPHIQEPIEIIYIREGLFDIVAGASSFAVSAGEMILVRSNVIHSIRSRELPRGGYHCLKIRPSLLFELASKAQAAAYVLRFVITSEKAKTHWTAEEMDSDGIAQAFALLEDRMQDDACCRDIALKLAAAEVLLALLRSIIRREAKQTLEIYSDSAAAQIYSVILKINRQYAEPLSALDCAAEVNMSYSYFSRIWKRIVRRSFREYLNEVRVSHAEHLLKTTSLPVTQIALECGYNNVSYFIAVYKELKGITPLSCRGEHAE